MYRYNNYDYPSCHCRSSNCVTVSVSVTLPWYDRPFDSSSRTQLEEGIVLCSGWKLMQFQVELFCFLFPVFLLSFCLFVYSYTYSLFFNLEVEITPNGKIILTPIKILGHVWKEEPVVTPVARKNSIRLKPCRGEGGRGGASSSTLHFSSSINDHHWHQSCIWACECWVFSCFRIHLTDTDYRIFNVCAWSFLCVCMLRTFDRCHCATLLIELDCANIDRCLRIW